MELEIGTRLLAAVALVVGGGLVLGWWHYGVRGWR
jgi:predicted acylesterase/phospholipase RssA